MGTMTDTRMAAWQKNAGIEPATGERGAQLQAMSRAAYDLIRIIELERSGIRGGDGFWHGSDALDGQMRELVELHQREKASAIADAESGRPRSSVEQLRAKAGTVRDHEIRQVIAGHAMPSGDC